MFTKNRTKKIFGKHNFQASKSLFHFSSGATSNIPPLYNQ